MSEERNSSQTRQNATGGMSKEEKRKLCMTKVGVWLSAANVIEQNIGKLEDYEKDAYHYIRNVFEDPSSYDKTTLVENQTTIREAALNFTGDFGGALGKFSGATGSICKDYNLFKECLEDVQSRSDSGQTISIKNKSIGSDVPAEHNVQSGIHNGTLIINGAKWEGVFDGATPVQSGKITFRDGTVYTGEWNAQGPNGRGVLLWGNGDKWTAVFANGDPVTGVIEYADGTRYEGGLNENGPHGRGRQQYGDRTDEGEYSDGERSGTGRIDWKDGDWYSGGWNEEGFNGVGTYYNARYKRRDHGTYRDGARVGRGRMEWETGKVYDGEWSDDGADGRGKWIYSNGDVYEGDFVRGERKGKGSIKFKNGDRYDGDWYEDNDGNLYGTGVYTWANGSKQNGSYVKNTWQPAQTVPPRPQPKQNSNTGSTGHFAPPVIEEPIKTEGNGYSAFTVIRNIVAWFVTLILVSSTFVCLQDDGPWWGMIFVGLIAFVAHWIYAGDGYDKKGWWNPMSILGIVIILNALIYAWGAIFGNDGWYYIIGAVFWGLIGLAAIGKGTDDEP